MKKPRTIADLKADPRIKSLEKDSDGWWAYLAPGYVIENCGNLSTIHEQTIKDVCNVLNNEVILDPYSEEEEYAADILTDHITTDHEPAPTDPLPTVDPIPSGNALSIAARIPQPNNRLTSTLATFETWCDTCTRALITAVVITYWLGYHSGRALHRLNDRVTLALA